VLGWWLTFTQIGLAPTRTHKLYSAHSYSPPTYFYTYYIEKNVYVKKQIPLEKKHQQCLPAPVPTEGGSGRNADATSLLKNLRESEITSTLRSIVGLRRAHWQERFPYKASRSQPKSTPARMQVKIEGL